MAHLAVAIADQPVEEFAQADAGSRTDGQPERLLEHPIQFGDARQVVSRPAEDPLADRRVSFVSRIGQDRDQPADQAPPVPQGRPCQFSKRFVEVGIVTGPLGVGGHGRRGEQPDRRLPEVVSRLMAVERVLGVVRRR